MSDSVRPHRRQPTRLPRPWDSPGKNTGVGCHFLLQRMKVKVKSLSRARLLATQQPFHNDLHILQNDIDFSYHALHFQVLTSSLQHHISTNCSKQSRHFLLFYLKFLLPKFPLPVAQIQSHFHIFRNEFWLHPTSNNQNPYYSFIGTIANDHKFSGLKQFIIL